MISRRATSACFFFTFHRSAKPKLIECSPDYLAALREWCDRMGAYLIFDDVICGFGRLGAWWGADHFGVRPDMVTFAKGVTSGYLPLGGVVVGPAVRAPLESDAEFVFKHGYTYSGHPLSAAAALANLDPKHIVADEQAEIRALETARG